MRIYYAGVRFTEETNDLLTAFRITHHIHYYEEPPMGFHSTFMFSRKFVSMNIYHIPEYPIGIAGESVELFGSSLVLPYNSLWLSAQHLDCRGEGATWDHSEFQPHVTIAEGVEVLTSLKPCRIPLFVSEIFYSEWSR